MYTIYYLEDEREAFSVDEALDVLSKLESDQVVDHHLVVVETDEDGIMEIALGMGGDSLLIYIPSNDDDDMKISCNSNIDRAKSEELILSHPSGDEVECSASNIVSFNEAMEVVTLFLNGEDFMDKLDWYSY